jgi:hypothetical protein
MSPDIKIRIGILETALMLEEMASAFLANLLSVKNLEDSLSFSNKNSALSFNQKINLLIDIGALDKSSRSKFQLFMEIRNQFMHNTKADTYELCFSFTDNKDTFILKTYPQDKKLPKEEQLKLAVDNLKDEVFALTAKVIKKIKSKIEDEFHAKFHKETFDDLIQSIEDVKKMLDDYIDEEILKDTNFTAKKLKGMGTFMSKLIYNHAIKKITNRL